MTTKALRDKQAAERVEGRADQESRLVHYIGPVGTGLFPGWGPKL
ncbi:MAG TPA: hypothetical protein VKT72_15910 [Candidatus Baltobacteraceae bacterium]|nr:hypothetical protein [Candidatus Baltobacteraceae bacterium]